MKECFKYQPELADYLEKKLSFEEEKELARHLAECPSCQQELGELEQTFAILGEEKGRELSDSFWSTFAVEIRERIEKKKSRAFVLRPRLVLIPAAVALVLFLAINLFRVDQGYLAKRTPGSEQNLAWLEEEPDQKMFAQELNQTIDEMSQEAEKAYWENENLGVLLAELSDQEFNILQEKVKNSKF